MADNLPEKREAQQHMDYDQAPLVYASEDLLRGRREVYIEHGEEMYRLRVTAAGRLYLTK